MKKKKLKVYYCTYLLLVNGLFRSTNNVEIVTLKNDFIVVVHIIKKNWLLSLSCKWCI